ncbi:MAG: cyanophycin synthetase, partial [Pygmaiobacter sp.]
CVVVSAPSQDAEVCSVIEAECAKLQVPLRVPEAEDVRVLWQTLKENHMDYGGYEVSLRMPGVHQAENAAVAIEAALALCDLGYTITDEAILAGLAKTKLPARIELVCTDPLTVIDGAHNPNGIATLAKTLREAKQPLMTGIIGMMRDKDVSALAALTPQFDCVYTVPACADARSFTPDELAAHCAAYFKQVEATPDLAAALKRAKQRGRGICICGSLYLAGEAEKFY